MLESLDTNLGTYHNLVAVTCSNGVRFTYQSMALGLHGRCADLTLAKRRVLASTIERKASWPKLAATADEGGCWRAALRTEFHRAERDRCWIAQSRRCQAQASRAVASARSAHADLDWTGRWTNNTTPGVQAGLLVRVVTRPSLSHSGAHGLILGFHWRLRSSLLGQGCTGMFNRGRLLACKYRCAESRSRSCDEHVAVAFNDAAHF